MTLSPAGTTRLSDLTSNVFSLVRTEVDPDRLIPRIVVALQESLDIEAVGIRIRDGLDFPYYFTRGFDPGFVELENHLCASDAAGEVLRDTKGDAYVECMCGNVICRRTDPSSPFFTPGGSFWSNCTTELLASTTPEQRRARTRNRCNSEGYESVALVPIPLPGENWHAGLIQLNDRRRDRFDLPLITFVEGLASCVGLAVRLLEAKRAIRGRVDDEARIGDLRTLCLKRIASALAEGQADEAGGPVSARLLEQLDRLIGEMERISGFVTICCQCKRVRVDPNSWVGIEPFVAGRTTARFSHTYCPACAAAFKTALANRK